MRHITCQTAVTGTAYLHQIPLRASLARMLRLLVMLGLQPFRIFVQNDFNQLICDESDELFSV